jgi:hypothetical protein
MRKQKFVDSGFTPAEADEIINGALNTPGATTKTVVTGVKAAQGTVDKIPTAVVAPTAQPTPTITPQAEAAVVKKYIGQSPLYDLSNTTSSPKQIEAAIDNELKRNGFKPTEFSSNRAGYLSDTFDADVAHLYTLKSKLETAKAGSPEKLKLEEAITAYKARCKSWKSLYIKANYTNTNILSKFDTQISRVCAD